MTMTEVGGARAGTGPAADDPTAWPPGWSAQRQRPARAATVGEWLAQHPEWPVIALLAWYPLWWALGVADFMVMLAAIPMAVRLLAWQQHGSRRIRLPPGFGLWLLFLILMLAGVFMLKLNAPQTVTSAMSRRLLSFALRAANYGAVTVVLVYAGNLTPAELPRPRLAWLLGLLAIYTTVGGVGGVLMPHFQFTSPLALVIPHSLQSSTLIGPSLHPGFSQVQSVLGGAAGRPKAPFDYTNDWGDALSITLPWLAVAWWRYGSRRQRVIACGVGVISLVPIIYSLNRGVWVGLALAAAFLAVRLAARGQTRPLAVICAGLVLAGVALLVTPLGTVVSQRLQHGHSDSIRSYLSAVAVKDGRASPVLGYGDTRHTQGSPNSIAVGPSPKCPRCGQYPVGSNGQLYLLLVCNGIVGTAVYLSFFAYGAWRYRRDGSAYGLAGVLVLLLSFVYMFTYTAPPIVLALTMLAYALLWRNDAESRAWSRSGVAPPATGPVRRRTPEGTRP